ncbi:MAG: glycosyltransferase family 2 protein [Candidatus Abyssubacteria bacterium]|nr:glycosyltransferase family 2 protein [Candidatus Abyssubacteria bacterium]
MDISIAIITWNSKGLLTQLLDSIRSDADDLGKEIIVVDNHSEDGTIEEIEKNYPEVLLIKNPTNEGVTKARNALLENANGKYILYLDVDTRVLPGAVSALVKAMDEHPDAVIGGPKLLYEDLSLQLSCRPFPSPLNILIEGTILSKYFPNSKYVTEYSMCRWDHAELREVDWMYGAALIIRRNEMDEIGLFDEGYFYLYEDIDYCYRARRLGKKVIYIPQAEIIHFFERESRNPLNRTLSVHIQSILRYLRKDYTDLLWRRFSGKWEECHR